MLNKKRTGCGATELAICNDVPTIIAMPYVALVKDKTVSRKDGRHVLGVYEGVAETDIIDYVQKYKPLKIATTYDALPRTVKALQNAGLDPYKDVFLLVDEYHNLFNTYVYRRAAIKALLTEAVKFGEITYMSATPIEYDYLPKELKQMSMCEIN